MEKCWYRVSVKAIIRDASKRILLLKEDTGKWELPGGGLEHDETIPISLRRELSEEIGAVVSHIDESPVRIWKSKVKRKGTIFYRLLLGYRVTTKKTGLRLGSHEALEARFFSIAEMKKLDLHANTRNFVSAGKSRR